MNPASSTSDRGDASAPDAGSAKSYRIFLSSPVDVGPEREAVERVVAAINAGVYDDTRFELIRWEDEYYTADRTFQDQIARPADCDIVICIFWKRLGSDLPDQYRRDDGSLPTGSEFEFEQAVQRAAASLDRVPDVLVYRKTAEVLFSEANLALEKAQRERFLAFWQRWFRNEKGQFVAGFHSFENTGAFEETVAQHLRQWLKDRAGDVIWTEGSPFRGLKPFDVEHARIFFGRRRETERARARFLANALAGVRFLLVVGPSGSGKSSLVRAGLIPRLAPAGGVGGLPHLRRHAIVTPAALVEGDRTDWTLGFGRALFAERALGRELAEGDFNTPERLAALLARGGPEAAAPVARALERAELDAGEQPGSGLILMVDQLEEIFAWPKAPAEAFATCLAALTASAPVCVIATMRSEFQHRLDEVPALAELAAVRAVRGPDEVERLLDIGVPGPADMREMIAGPARAAGLVLAGSVGDLPDLQTRIEREAAPDALPALQYLLTELYERRDGNMLTHAAYETLGGVTGVLSARGEAVLAEHGAAGEAAFVNLVRSLIRTGTDQAPAVSRRIRTDLFAPVSAEGRLAAALRDAGLLVSDRSTFRLAHESLITGWARLGTIIANERRLLNMRERLVSAFHLYREVPDADHAARSRRLLQGLALEEGRELLSQWSPALLRDPYPELPDFIAASERADRGRRWRRVAAASALSAAFGVAALAILWFWNQGAQSARNAEVRLELARAEAALRAQDWDRAVEAAIRARRLDDSADTRSIALTAVMEHSSPHLSGRLAGPAAAARFDAAGGLITLSRSGLLTLPATASGPRRSFRLSEPDAPDNGYFDFAPLPDGGFVVLMSDGRVGVLEPNGLQAASQPLQPTWLTKGGYTLALPSLGDIHVGEAQLRVGVANDDLTPGRLLTCSISPIRDCRETELRAGAQLGALAFSQDGRQLAIADDEGIEIARLDPAAGTERLRQAPGTAALRTLGWAADKTLILGATGGELITVGTDRRDLLVSARRTVSTGVITLVKGAPTGRQIATPCDEDFICLVDFDRSGALERPTRLYHVPSSILRLAWSKDGGQLASVHADAHVRVWNHAPQRPVLDALAPIDVPLTALAVERATGRIAAGDAVGQIWTWPHGNPGEPSRHFEPGPDEVVHLAFSSKGILAAAFKNGDLARIDPDPNARIEKTPTGSNIQRVGWLPDGTTLAATTPTGLVVLDASGKISRHDIGMLKPNQTIGGLVTAPDGRGLIVSISDGTLVRWVPESGKPAEPVTPLKDSGDALSALSLAVHPKGRWLAATRADDQLRIYDVTGRAPPRVVALPTRNSTAIAFSPDGALLAALMSDDWVHVWRFDPAQGQAEPIFGVRAVPSAKHAKEGSGSPRQARWIDWIADNRLGIATRGGEVLVLSVDLPTLQARLDALAPR